MMQHLDFIVWMLGFPLMCSLDTFILSLVKGREYKKPSPETAMVLEVLWFGIGILLW
jgi:hypothetical protein